MNDSIRLFYDLLEKNEVFVCNNIGTIFLKKTKDTDLFCSALMLKMR